MRFCLESEHFTQLHTYLVEVEEGGFRVTPVFTLGGEREDLSCEVKEIRFDPIAGQLHWLYKDGRNGWQGACGLVLKPAQGTGSGRSSHVLPAPALP